MEVVSIYEIIICAMFSQVTEVGKGQFNEDY